MHITVFCPHCQSRYQLEPALRGKRMRCKNTICLSVFEIREDEGQGEDEGREQKHENPLALQTTLPVTGSVALLARDDLGIPGDDEGASAGPPGKSSDGPVEMEPGSWEVPPVRTETCLEPGEEVVLLANNSLASPLHQSAARFKPKVDTEMRGRRRLGLIGAMLLVLGVVLGGGIYLVGSRSAENEAERFKKAQELYHNQDFAEATGAFQELLREFPSSASRRQYDFLVELSAVRQAAYAQGDPPEDRARALERVLEFLSLYKNDPLLKEYHDDIWRTLERLARELTKLAERVEDAEYLQCARRSWAEARKFTPPAGGRADETAKAVDAEFARVDKLLAALAARQALLDGLRGLAALGTADAVREGRTRAKSAGMEHDAEVLALLDELVKAHRAKIVFTAATASMAAPPIEDLVANLYIAPRAPRRARPGALDGNGTLEPDVVLALARGVLYALDATWGNVRWVRRVGVDTSVLPLRAPAALFAPEMFLVLSSDSKSVAAVAAAAGNVIWEHALGAVCLGQPVLVDRHLLVPTLAGQVEDIEITGGALQGSYALDQPLAVGGVHQPGTTLVYFPADSYCVYVLDVAQRTCAAILYTGHAPGSLRGLPMIWNDGEAAAGTGWLLLNLASGEGSVELRPYALPVRQPDQKPADLSIKVPGDSWAASWHDDEKLAVATNAGLLAVYGIRQKGNRDPLLFSLLPEAHRLESESRARQARAQVMHADAENYWVSSGGKLQRLQAVFTAAKGPDVAARWPQPLRLGSPLHASQFRTGADGKLTLFVVTQDLDSPTCWIRAVDAEEGRVLWQRQLGMVCQDQPVAANGLVLCPDAKGLFLFHAAPASLEKSWQPAGTLLEVPGKIAGHWSCAYAPGFVCLSWRSDGMLQVRLVDGKELAASKTYSLPALPLGTPALGSDCVLLPLANGMLYRVPLLGGAPGNGPEWRGGIGAADSQPGYIVALGNNVFAITDGSRSLMRLRWGEANFPEKEGSTEMPRRITAAPVVLGDRLVVTDASDTVTLLDSTSLVPQRRWALGGKITTAPFVRAGGLGIVIGNNRLVWLDPAKDQIAWEYSFVAPIVGQPDLVDGLLVVADLQGGIMALDPATGNPAGPGYRLDANAAPTAAPIAFGAGQLFVPITDGTVMILPMDRLR